MTKAKKRAILVAVKAKYLESHYFGLCGACDDVYNDKEQKQYIRQNPSNEFKWFIDQLRKVNETDPYRTFIWPMHDIGSRKIWLDEQIELYT